MAAKPSLAVLTCLLGSTCLSACERSEAPVRRPAPVTGASAKPAAELPSAPAPPVGDDPKGGDEPLELSGDRMVPLAVPGFGEAVVSVPVGGRAPVAWVVALHGNYDRPEWQCGVWAPIASTGAFVVCPRGVSRKDAPRGSDRWTYTTLEATRRELDAVEKAFIERFGEYVGSARPTLLGFSLGAIYGARLAVQAPERYPRLILIEGGEKGWSRATVRRYLARGGERVLIACAQTVCRNAARALEPVFESAELGYRHVSALGAGHTYDGPVAERVAAEWNWVLAGVGADPDTRSAAPEP